jgi:predicted secreted protein
MSIAHPRITTLGMLVAMSTGMAAEPALAGEPARPDDQATIEIAAAVEFLVPASELDEVNMSVIDEKLALSLAVETHVHMDVMEFALHSMSDADLRALTQRKLRSCQQLYNTLDDLTGGRVEAMLGRGARRATGDVAADDAVEAGADQAETRTSKKRRGGGLGNVLQSAATRAILRVRLEIAEQYAVLLRAELEASPPGEFDRRYMNVELYNQMQVLSMLRVFERQASGEFGRVIHVATLATEQYLGEGKHLVDQLRNTLPIPVPPGPVVSTSDPSNM